MKEFEENTKIILSKIDDDDVMKEADAISSTSQGELLRNSTYRFIQDQMRTVENYKKVINNALRSLDERIDKNELDAKDTLSVISSLSSQVTHRTQVILEPFKPSPQSSSPLLTPPRQEDSSPMEKGIESLSSQELQILDSNIRKINSIKKDSNS